MVAAVQWEYALFYIGGSGSSIDCYWNPGDGFLADAKEWFGKNLDLKKSSENQLSFGQVSDIYAISFMGKHGWELVSSDWIQPNYATRLWFKRPWGNSGIAGSATATNLK
jgi:hypothetical protein